MARDLRFLLLAAVLGVGLSLAQSAGLLHADALHLVPFLVLVLPLLAGRYVGEERLGRLAAVFSRPRPRAERSVAMPAARPRQWMRGGRLIAASLAQRGPPALVAS